MESIPSRRSSPTCRSSIRKRSRTKWNRTCWDISNYCRKIARSIFPRNLRALFMTSRQPNPLALVCELTHRCPLHCVYCSNPRELAARATELSTDAWSSVFRQAAELGVLQTDFTGGEPLARTDIIELVRSARAAGLYA